MVRHEIAKSQAANWIQDDKSYFGDLHSVKTNRRNAVFIKRRKKKRDWTANEFTIQTHDIRISYRMVVNRRKRCKSKVYDSANYESKTMPFKTRTSFWTKFNHSRYYVQKEELNVRPCNMKNTNRVSLAAMPFNHRISWSELITTIRNTLIQSIFIIYTIYFSYFSYTTLFRSQLRTSLDNLIAFAKEKMSKKKTFVIDSNVRLIETHSMSLNTWMNTWIESEHKYKWLLNSTAQHAHARSYTHHTHNTDTPREIRIRNEIKIEKPTKTI